MAVEKHVKASFSGPASLPSGCLIVSAFVAFTTFGAGFQGESGAMLGKLLLMMISALVEARRVDMKTVPRRVERCGIVGVWMVLICKSLRVDCW